MGHLTNYLQQRITVIIVAFGDVARVTARTISAYVVNELLICFNFHKLKLLHDIVGFLAPEERYNSIGEVL